MKTQYFILPLIAYSRAYLVNAEIRFVTNPKHKNYKKVKIYTNMHYNPLIEHKNYNRFMTLTNAQKLLKDLGFIKVPDNFDEYNIKDLRKIKSKLPKKWINAFNMWANYTG